MDEKANEPVSPGRKGGRPRKVDGPRVPYDEIDRLLVHGEVVPTDDGMSTTVVYPSHRDLARRYGCSHSLIAAYAKRYRCLRRREEAQARVMAKADQKLIEMRATAIALSRDDALRMIDTYLAGFEKVLAEGRVRFDSPTDFNTMLRLKEFILGGADSRQEIHAALSLEDIQARHQRMLRTAQQASVEERGEVLDVLPADDSERSDHILPGNSPATPSEAAAGEVPGQFEEAAPAVVAGRVAPRRDEGAGADDEARDRGRAPRAANVAPTGPSSSASEPDSPANEDEGGPTRRTR